MSVRPGSAQGSEIKMQIDAVDPEVRPEGFDTKVMDEDPTNSAASSAAATATPVGDRKDEKYSSMASPVVEKKLTAAKIDSDMPDVNVPDPQDDIASGRSYLCKDPRFKQSSIQLKMHIASKAGPAVKQNILAEGIKPKLPNVNSRAHQDDTTSGLRKPSKNPGFKTNSDKLETPIAAKVGPAIEDKMQAEGSDPKIPNVHRIAPQKNTTSGTGKLRNNPSFTHNKLETFLASRVGPATEKVMQAKESGPKIPDVNNSPSSDDSASGRGKLCNSRHANLGNMLQKRLLGQSSEAEMHPEGVGARALDLDCNKAPPADESATTPLAQHPVYARYFRMLKVQTPKPAVEAEMIKHGHDPAVLSLDPNKAMPSDFSSKKGGVDPAPLKKDNGPEKANPKPRVPMRSLFWSKIAERDKTVWKKLSDENIALPNEVLDSLEADFAKQRKEKDKDEKSTAAAKRQEERKKEVTLLDSKVSQNVGIRLHKLKMSKTEIRDAIVAVDEEKLDAAKCELLLKSCPTPEDMAAVAEFAGNTSTLGRVEQYFLEIACVPDIKNRLECMLFKHKLESTFEALDTRLKTVTVACEHVSRSDRLAKLLEVVLRVGNYLNGGTSRGGVWGFKLDALAKLATIKSLDNTKTLMNWLVQWCQDNDPSLIHFHGDFPEIGNAARCSLTQWTSDFGQLRTKIKLLDEHITARRKQAPPGDRFVEVMTPFYDRAASAIEKLHRRFMTTEARFGDLVRSFGEDPMTCGVEDFFKNLLGDFVACFKKARQQNEKRKAMEEEARQQNEKRKIMEEEARQREQAAERRASHKAADENSETKVNDAGKGLKLEDTAEIIAKIQGPRQRRNATRERRLAAAAGDQPLPGDSSFSDERLRKYVCRINGVSAGSKKDRKIKMFRTPRQSQHTWSAPVPPSKSDAGIPKQLALKPADDEPPHVLPAARFDADDETSMCPPTAQPRFAITRLNSAESQSKGSRIPDESALPANKSSRTAKASVSFLGTVTKIQARPQSLETPSSPTPSVSQSSSSPQSSAGGTPRKVYGEGELLQKLNTKLKKKKSTTPT